MCNGDVHCYCKAVHIVVHLHVRVHVKYGLYTTKALQKVLF